MSKKILIVFIVISSAILLTSGCSFSKDFFSLLSKRPRQPDLEAILENNLTDSIKVESNKPQLLKRISQHPVTANILMYHHIGNGANQFQDKLRYNLTVTPAEFDAQLTALEKAGYKSATMSQAINGETDAKSVVLTFDDGYSDLLTTAWPILKKHNWTATTYISSNLVSTWDHLSWEQIDTLAAAGIEIGGHSFDHFELNQMSEADQRDQIEKNLKDLQKLNHVGNVYSFCYPAGKYNDTTIKILKEVGYLSATSEQYGTARDSKDYYALPRIRIEPGISPATLLDIIK